MTRTPAPAQLRTLAFLALGGAAAAAAAGAATTAEVARTAAATITDARCRAHVAFLASDALEGRATPSRGLDIAAEYIAAQFERDGLAPGGDGGSWFQAFPIVREVRLVSSALAAGGRAFEYGADYVPLPMTGRGAAEGRLVFAGYGITAPEASYDDYAGIDARGKVVLVLRHQPREKDGTFAAQPPPQPPPPPAEPSAAEREGRPRGRGRRGFSRHALYETKIANAAKHGAVALLLVTDPANHETTAPEGRWPSRGETRGAEIPAVHVSLAAAMALLGGRDLAALQREIDGDLEPRSFEVQGAKVRVAVELEHVMDRGRNVVGVRRGSDPALAGEAVVIGAHYDHVGVEGEDGPAFPGQIGGIVDGDRIHNGADDNASGTAALLEIARAFGDAALAPARTIVFVAFAGEELGLVGSRWYVEHPTVPIERTAAMLNLDMVGRNEVDHLFIGGSPDAALEAALETANEAAGMKLERVDARRLSSASDHASFQRAGVPTVFFYSGNHPDYHRVTDDRTKIVAGKIARVAQLALLTAAAVADDPAAGERPAERRLF